MNAAECTGVMILFSIVVLAVVFFCLRRFARGDRGWQSTVLGPVLLAGLLGFIIGGVVNGYYTDREIFDSALFLTVLISSIVGFASVFDAIIHIRELAGAEKMLLVGSAVLFISPLLVIIKADTLVMLAMMMFGGTVLTVYGYHILPRSPARGLLYLYGSAMVIVIIPMIVLVLMDTATRIGAPVTVYHTRPDFVTCHARYEPPLPVEWAFSGQDGSPAYIASLTGFTALASALQGLNRWRARRKLALQGHIPHELGNGKSGEGNA